MKIRIESIGEKVVENLEDCAGVEIYKIQAYPSGNSSNTKFVKKFLQIKQYKGLL